MRRCHVTRGRSRDAEGVTWWSADKYLLSGRPAAPSPAVRMCWRLSAVFVAALLASPRSSSADTYVLSDDGGLGRDFDGIGGLSGGGVSNVRLRLPVRCTRGPLALLTVLRPLSMPAGHLPVTGELPGAAPQPDPRLPVQGETRRC